MPPTATTTAALPPELPLPPASDGLWGLLVAVTVALVLGQLSDKFFAYRLLSIARWVAWISAVILFAQFIGRLWNQPVSAATYAVGWGALVLLVAGWRTLGEVFAGGLLLFGRRHHLGERLQIGPNHGVLERMGLTSITLRQGDGGAVLIPNSTLFRDTVAYPNPAGGETPTRFRCAVPPDIRPEQAQVWAERAALTSSFASPYRRPQVTLTREGPAWILEIQAFGFDPNLGLALQGDVLLRFERLCRSAGDEPAPTR